MGVCLYMFIYNEYYRLILCCCLSNISCSFFLSKTATFFVLYRAIWIVMNATESYSYSVAIINGP